MKQINNEKQSQRDNYYLEREREEEKLPDNNAISLSLAYIHN